MDNSFIGFIKRIKSYFLGRYLFILVVIVLLIGCVKCKPKKTTKICLDQGSRFIKARRKSCFLRPDTGPCRADLIQYYYDAKKARCYRFFWGGCQGNGNKFETRKECMEYCYVNFNQTNLPAKIPYYCGLTFDFGTCFGYYNRWYWNSFYKSCRRRIYSGCGGNQNNFETQEECINTCLKGVNSTYVYNLPKNFQFSTCIPLVW